MSLIENVVEGSGLYKHTFKKLNQESNLLVCNILESQYVVVSTEKRPAVATGIVSYKDSEIITISLDR